MTQEEKQLLLKDLCARLPYGVKIGLIGAHKKLIGEPFTLDVEDYENSNPLILINSNWLPYLRPMSSMTEEEREEWADKFNLAMDELSSILDEKEAEDAAPYMFAKSHFTSIDWLLAHHFDYCGLIERGLALEAPEGMYKTE